MVSMVLTEFNEEVYTKGIKAEGRAEILYDLVESCELSTEKAASMLGKTSDQLIQDMTEKGYVIL